MEAEPVRTHRDELLFNVQRLAGVALSRLEEGSRDRSLGPRDIRLLAAVALRSLRLWREVLADQGLDRRRLEKKIRWVQRKIRVADSKEDENVGG